MFNLPNMFNGSLPQFQIGITESKEEFFSVNENCYRVEYQCCGKRFNYENTIDGRPYMDLRNDAEKVYMAWFQEEFGTDEDSEIGEPNIGNGEQ